MSPPVWRKSRDDHFVAGLEILHFPADFNNFADGFVSENQVAPLSDSAFVDGMNVRCSRRQCQRFDNGVQGSASWTFLFDPSRLPDFQHSKCTHGTPLCLGCCKTIHGCNRSFKPKNGSACFFCSTRTEGRGWQKKKDSCGNLLENASHFILF